MKTCNNTSICQSTMQEKEPSSHQGTNGSPESQEVIKILHDQSMLVERPILEVFYNPFLSILRKHLVTG